MNVARNIAAVRARIRAATAAAGRAPDSVDLVGVAKAQPAESVADAWDAGLRHFGENYLRDAAPHIAAAPDAEWHFIGRVQSNKTRAVAERFAWVQTVDRVRIAERLAGQRPAHLPPLNVCIQVNLDEDPAKGGVDADGAFALATTVAGLPHLRLRGLMAVPRQCADPASQRRAFAAVRTLFDAMCAQGFALDTLSIGMSGDLEAAIAEGATMVRVGTALFGARP